MGKVLAPRKSRVKVERKVAKTPPTSAVTTPNGGNGAISEDYLKKVNEELYKRNAELAVRNKTLSLLRELYQISILSLDPKALSVRIAEAIQKSLNFELIGIMHVNELTNMLQPFGFAFSERFANAHKKSTDFFTQTNLSAMQAHVLQQVAKGPLTDATLSDVWGESLPVEIVDAVRKSAHIKSTSVFPLIIKSRIIGLFVLSLNRSYAQLNEFEADLIASFIDVIAVALDRSIIYEQLSVANQQLETTNAELKRLDATKSEFISIASHQLRTPLTVIKGYISMLLEGSFGTMTDVERDALNKVFQSNERLINLVEDLLNISRIESGRMEFQLKSTDLLPIVDEMVEGFKKIATEKKLDLAFEHDSQMPPVLADGEKLREVMSNIIDNALKYTKQGNVTVRVKHVGNELIFSVTDTGHGIEPDDMDNLFKKFSRGKGMSLMHTEGTGLGLYVARKIIDAHGGRIWAESKGLDKGSTFSFALKIPTPEELKTGEKVVKASELDLGQE